jgi:hypothetical protein
MPLRKKLAQRFHELGLIIFHGKHVVSATVDDLTVGSGLWLGRFGGVAGWFREGLMADSMVGWMGI